MPRIEERSLLDRLLSKVMVVTESGCWIWMGSVTGGKYGGYGQLIIAGKRLYAHRVSFEIHKGPIPVGEEADHLCRVHSCINPHHLKAKTHQGNLSCGVVGHKTGALNAAKTHCPQGHPYSGRNLITRKAGNRQCRACAVARCQRRRSHAKHS